MQVSEDASAALRKCVHCGFCLATCPTYQVLGDELDSPRGRLYLMKQVFEGKAPTATTQQHLDRCLTCRACETTCPSGVDYHVVLDAGRAAVDAQVERPLWVRLKLWVLRELLPQRALFGAVVRLGRVFGWLLPGSLRRQLSVMPAQAGIQSLEGTGSLLSQGGRVLLLQGCVQPALRPNINAATTRVLARLGFDAIEVPGAGCCGALRHHLDEHEDALDDARLVIDEWWPHIFAGAKAIVVTASGCGAHVADYGRLLRDDPDYADKAQRVSELLTDLADLIEPEAARLFASARAAPAQPIAFQSPCTLQHGLRIRGTVERVLEAAGYQLTPVSDAHLCCGSAGTYSILQPELSRRLRDDKLAALEAGKPAAIATANIGCQTHLAGGTTTPVHHWIELIEQRLV